MTHNEKVLALLSDGKPHSHHELYGLYVMGHSRVADLRKQGHDIRCWREGDLYLYRLLGGAEGAHAGNEQPASGSRMALRSSEQAAPPQEAPSHGGLLVSTRDLILDRVHDDPAKAADARAKKAAACSPIQLELETESRFGSSPGGAYASGESRAA